MQYKSVNPIFGNTNPTMVLCVDTSTWVPFDPANKDYQAYLAWLEAGNTPEPADEPSDV